MHLLSKRNSAGDALSTLAAEISTTEERLNDFSFKQAVQERLSPRREENDDGTSHIGDLHICHPNDPAHTRNIHVATMKLWQSRTERLSKPCAVKFRLRVHHHYRPWEWPGACLFALFNRSSNITIPERFYSNPQKATARTPEELASIVHQQAKNYRSSGQDRPSHQDRLNHYHDAAEKLRSIR